MMGLREKGLTYITLELSWAVKYKTKRNCTLLDKNASHGNTDYNLGMDLIYILELYS